MYAEDVEMDENLPDNLYFDSEMKDMEMMFMGTESEARKRVQRNRN